MLAADATPRDVHQRSRLVCCGMVLSRRCCCRRPARCSRPRATTQFHDRRTIEHEVSGVECNTIRVVVGLRGVLVEDVTDLESVLRRLGDRPLRVALAVHADRDAAQDAVQEGCLRYVRFRDRGGVIEHPEAFLLACVVNEARRGRSRSLRDSTLVSALAGFASEQPAQGAELDGDLWAAIQRLPAKQRAALGLRYYLDLSDDQIADVLGCRPATVRSLVHRALTTLRGVGR